MVDETPTAYVWETKRGMYIVEANEDLLFFRSLRALRSARTVGDLWEIDEGLGLGLKVRWDDMWSIFPTDEDFEFYGQWSDDSRQLDHWRDHPVTASFAFEFPYADMPRPYDEWVPEEVCEILYDWMADDSLFKEKRDDYLVKKRYAAQALLLLQQHGIRLVDEPALADVFEGQS
jgi:hypothetical protein